VLIVSHQHNQQGIAITIGKLSEMDGLIALNVANIINCIRLIFGMVFPLTNGSHDINNKNEYVKYLVVRSSI
jgi:hypothetical protein